MNDSKDHGACARVVGKAMLLFESHEANSTDVKEKDTPRDLVSGLDNAIQRLICAELSVLGYSILSEEDLSTWDRPEDPVRPLWVVDPIDGTTNFISGIPFFGVSVGLMRAQLPLVGSFGMPRTKEIFYTVSSSSAYKNDVRLKASEALLKTSLVGACFSSRPDSSLPQAREVEMAAFQAMNDSSRGCLRLGSAGGSICYVASGKLGAAFGLFSRIWDIAGAMAVARAAGCQVLTAQAGAKSRLHFLVGSGAIVSQAKAILARCVAPEFWEGD
jgi:myo-inositol-1(or 4)-monophosphatase